MRISDWSSDVCSSDLFLRIEELPIPGLGAATGAAMHEHRRDALRIAAFLDMDFVQLGNAQAMGLVRLDGRIGLRHERKFLRIRTDGLKLTVYGKIGRAKD